MRDEIHALAVALLASEGGDSDRALSTALHNAYQHSYDSFKASPARAEELRRSALNLRRAARLIESGAPIV